MLLVSACGSRVNTMQSYNTDSGHAAVALAGECAPTQKSMSAMARQERLFAAQELFVLGLIPLKLKSMLTSVSLGMQAEASAVRNVIPVRLFATIPGIEMPSARPLHIRGPVFAIVAMRFCVITYSTCRLHSIAARLQAQRVPVPPTTEIPTERPGGPGVEPGPEVTEPPGTAPGGLPQQPEIPHTPPEHETPQQAPPGARLGSARYAVAVLAVAPAVAAPQRAHADICAVLEFAQLGLLDS